MVLAGTACCVCCGHTWIGAGLWLTKELSTTWTCLGGGTLLCCVADASDGKGCRLIPLAWYGMYCPGLRVASWQGILHVLFDASLSWTHEEIR